MKFQSLRNPERSLPPQELERIRDEARVVARVSLGEPLPEYSILRAHPLDLDNGRLELAWSDEHRLEGFSAAFTYFVPGVGTVLHLGLTCIRPERRGSALGRILLTRILARYALERLGRGGWFSNLSSVVHALVKVSNHCADVFPNRQRTAAPAKHLRIAKYLAENCAQRVFARPDAQLDEQAFIWRGCNTGNVFSQHISESVATDYERLFGARLQQSDAVLQVGRVGVKLIVLWAGHLLVGRWLG